MNLWRCENCAYYYRKGKGSGACRAKPPVIADEHEYATFPKVGEKCWCGGFLLTQDFRVPKAND